MDMGKQPIFKRVKEKGFRSIDASFRTFFIVMLITTAFIANVGYAQTFDWENTVPTPPVGDGVTKTITQTVSGITVTVQADAGTDYLQVFDASAYSGTLGTSGYILLSSGSASYTFTFSFSEAVDIQSIYAVEASGATGSTWTYTPTGGSNSTVNDAISAFTGHTVTLNWTGVTSFDVTKPSDASAFAFDDLILGTASATVTFVNGANAGLNFVQSNAVPPVSNWLFGQFSLAGDETGATLNSVTVTLGGTYDSGDLESTPFQLYASNTNDFSTSSALGSSVADPGAGSDVTFSGLSDAIPASTRYYWVTADISASATSDDTMNGTIDAAGDLSITTGTLSGSSSYGKLNAGTDASLPVDLSSFSAVCEGQSVILEWVTESETDNLGFILERSVDGESWTTIASYQTNDDLKGQGNTSSKTEYTFTDTDVEPGVTYEYRISDVSTDGKVTVYASLSIEVDALPEVTAMEKAYPNPFNPSTYISYHLAEDSQVEISVYDMLGRKVQTLFTGQQLAGSYNVYWHGKSDNDNVAPTGTYLIRMQTENTAQVQKVLLMK